MPDTNIFIQVQQQDFALAEHHALLAKTGGGAVCLFCGLVRDLPQGNLQALEIEHFAAMARVQLTAIAGQANKRWPLHAIRLVHRYGRLKPGEQIVLVGTAADHRDAAFAACQFIMDFLKTDAPFWKKIHTSEGSSWVAARAADTTRRSGWEMPTKQ